jgi:hypothetical protein
MPTKTQILNNLSDESIASFAEFNGAAELLRSWCEHMLPKGRNPDPDYLKTDAAFIQERERLARIAYEVILDFVDWATSHPHG